MLLVVVHHFSPRSGRDGDDVVDLDDGSAVMSLSQQRASIFAVSTSGSVSYNHFIEFNILRRMGMSLQKHTMSCAIM